MLLLGTASTVNIITQANKGLLVSDIFYKNSFRRINQLTLLSLLQYSSTHLLESIRSLTHTTAKTGRSILVVLYYSTEYKGTMVMIKDASLARKQNCKTTPEHRVIVVIILALRCTGSCCSATARRSQTFASHNASSTVYFSLLVSIFGDFCPSSSCIEFDVFRKRFSNDMVGEARLPSTILRSFSKDSDDCVSWRIRPEQRS
jgi:hypothetical protein